MQTGDHGGPIFTYPFAASTLSTAGNTDLWCITAPSNSRFTVREVVLGQTSDAGDAQAEMLGITFMSGSTAPSSGTAITGLNINRYSTAQTPAASCTVVGPSTTLASTASAALIRAEAFNVMGGYRYYPVPSERHVIGLSQRLVIRITTPNDPLTIYGTLMLQEIGQTPQ